ncbi:CotH kinase family protein [Clostridium sp. LIBA-8841]|uniref:CotH kinase family protein n=1 Tax=Clostridium sp. LIBA-8841 TaxID=2987530 RepID=UPI002AC549A3|nr:CotH kinase family protein [Clostridium sp. LIBA-8841]MDZ5253224.1 CotH kinase family protein [Clostridium sp. LIBA-8841]
MKSKRIFWIIFTQILLAVFFIGCTSETFKEKESNNKEFSKEENEKKEGYNLPLVVIDTNGKKINGNESINGTIKIYDSEDGINSLSDEPILESNIQIKIRGNTTRRVPKKQYSIDLMDENEKKREEEILGMPKESEWILNAPFEDKSLLRNYLAYNISGEIMEYAPRAKYCEAFIVDDGEHISENHYKGVFLMIEQIKRDENRVNISKSNSSRDETSFIVEKNNPKEKDIVLHNYGKETYLYDYPILASYPKKDLTEGQMDYISKTISIFERSLYSNEFENKNIGYEKYIDVDTFVDYYIINEFFNNTDAGILSTYLHKDFGEKIKAGPVWDFNASMGNSNVLSPYYDYKGFYMNRTAWFDRLMEDKSFVTKVINRYKLLRKTYLSDEYLIEFIDNTVKMLGDAPNRNFEVWPIYMCNQFEMFKDYRNDFSQFEDDPKKLDEYLKDNTGLFKSTENMATSYNEEIEMLKVFLVNRGRWIDENIDKLYKWTE